MINESNTSLEFSKRSQINNQLNIQQKALPNNSFVNNTSAIYPNSKVNIKPPSQSFYDDGLLDLIEEMNP